MAKKTISIFGCTGSVGTTTLDIIRENKEQFEVKVLTANKNIDDLILFANEFNPEAICCLLYTSPSPRDTERSRMPSSA